MALLSSSPNTSSPTGAGNTISAPSSPHSLPPITTSPPSQPTLHRAITTKAAHRFSTFSIHSNTTQAGGNATSRPQSTAFPFFHSSLPYALVRDFAYPSFHPLHYGPPPDSASGMSTPASTNDHHRRLSDPAPTWDGSRGQWSAAPWAPGDDLHIATGPAFGEHDGPPWKEDEDLHSPVVTSARHRKNKSSQPVLESAGRSKAHRISFTRRNGDGNSTSVDVPTSGDSNGPPSGGLITYPPSHTRANLEQLSEENRRNSHFAGLLPNRSYAQNRGFPSDYIASPRFLPGGDDDDSIASDENRLSRSYQFTIASPDEEMHGKAIALFDFARESEVELPLTEGQVVLISYRHGQGWLVAEDPKTHESGLVPEEYVRLLRDIEGGYHGLMNNNQSNNGAGSAAGGAGEVDSSEAKTPTQEFGRSPGTGGVPTAGAAGGEFYPPVVSKFSTSREDFEPHHKVSTSQVNTPTTDIRRGSEILSPRRMEVEPKTKVEKEAKVTTTEVGAVKNPE